MLAYNLNAWRMLLNREPQSDVNALKHTTLATSRLRFLFIAAKIWRHAGSHRRHLQRSLRREDDLSAFDGAVTKHCFATVRFHSCHRRCAPMNCSFDCAWTFMNKPQVQRRTKDLEIN